MRKSHSVRILFELGPIINAQNARQQYLSFSQHFSKTRGTALVIGAAESCPIVSSKSLSLESVLVLDEASIKLQIWRIRCHCSFSVILRVQASDTCSASYESVVPSDSSWSQSSMNF